MEVGIIGGTFDPIHIGHLIAAEQARTALELDKVIFIPAGQPWLKVNNGITPAPQRAEMVNLAIASNPHFELCSIELERHGPSYTIDTIIELRQKSDICMPYFILGQDSINSLPTWKEPVELLKVCRLAVVPRSGLGELDLCKLEKSIKGIKQNVVALNMPTIEISSSDIRSRVSKGQSIRYLVQPDVEQYIETHKLYR